jgi:hypothetical protein
MELEHPITIFTVARLCFLYWAKTIQFITSLPISFRFVLLLSSHLGLRLEIIFFLWRFSTRISYLSSLTRVLCTSPVSQHSSISAHNIYPRDVTPPEPK